MRTAQYISSTTALILLSAVLLLGPTSVSAQQVPSDVEDSLPTGTGAGGTSATTTSNTSSSFLRDGIFGCNGSEYSMSAGTRSAIGGVYVPTNDAAVTLNTGTLIYKECVLDGVVSAMREAGTAGLADAFLNLFNTGNNGEPQFVTNLGQERTSVSNQAVVDWAGYGANVICSPYRQEVRANAVRNYLARTQQGGAGTRCSFPGTDAQQQAFIQGDIQGGGGWSALWETANNPQNGSFGAYLAAQRAIRERTNQAVADAFTQYGWSGGVRPITQTTQVPTTSGGTRSVTEVVTPGFLLSEIVTQMTGTGFRQLESATEIDQIISSLFSGLSTQILGTTGLEGLSYSQNGNPPYLDRVVNEASARVRQTAVNAALQSLAPALSVERDYRDTKLAAQTFLNESADRLRNAESQCWGLIEDAVSERAQQGTCTTTTDQFGQQTQTCDNIPLSFTVATSTQRSTQVITQNITPLLNAVSDDIEVSESAVTRLEQLVARVTNTASIVEQRNALAEFDSMVANRELHNTFDLREAEEQTGTIRAGIQDTVDNTLEDWGSGAGWCNVNNPAVVDDWLDEWRN